MARLQEDVAEGYGISQEGCRNTTEQHWEKLREDHSREHTAERTGRLRDEYGTTNYVKTAFLFEIHVRTQQHDYKHAHAHTHTQPPSQPITAAHTQLHGRHLFALNVGSVFVGCRQQVFWCFLAGNHTQTQACACKWTHTCTRTCVRMHAPSHAHALMLSYMVTACNQLGHVLDPDQQLKGEQLPHTATRSPRGCLLSLGRRPSHLAW